MRNKEVTIIGAGLAGSEAALLLAKYGFKVDLYDQKLIGTTSAYEMKSYAELVCNNSLGPIAPSTPLGLLRCELEYLNSELVQIANKCRVSDERYFAVDKTEFSLSVTEALVDSGVKINEKIVDSIPTNRPLIIATGPLSNHKLMADIAERFQINNYHFADACSPIVDISSIDTRNKCYKKISEDLYAVAIPNESFNKFKAEIAKAQIYISHIEESHIITYEKCQSIESLAKRGDECISMRFCHPYCEGNQPCLLLRRESALKKAFILVGCMTMMRHSEQKRVFSMLPGFENCKFIKYGRMHSNTFFDSPKFLNNFYKVKTDDVYVIGQISGVDGYLPAISSGFVAAYHLIKNNASQVFPTNSMIGALANYVSNPKVVDFQPMCASFELMSSTKENYQSVLAEYRL